MTHPVPACVQATLVDPCVALSSAPGLGLSELRALSSRLAALWQCKQRQYSFLPEPTLRQSPSRAVAAQMRHTHAKEKSAAIFLRKISNLAKPKTSLNTSTRARGQTGGKMHPQRSLGSKN